jgi:hypothetical protein
MRLLPVVYKLRQADTVFVNRIAGAAELALTMSETHSLVEEAAFVIQLNETTNANTYQTSINQTLIERFAVVVALKNDQNQKEVLGLEAFDRLHAIRAQIFKAILGWTMENTLEAPISYSTGRLLDIDRAFIWYQFEFITATRITDEDGVDNNESALPYLTTLSAQIVGPNDVVGGEVPSELLPPLLNTYIQSSPEFDEGFDTSFDTPATQ